MIELHPVLLGMIVVLSFGTGVLFGLPGSKPARPLSGPETPEDSLRRLGASRVPQKGGQRVMGPQQPRPRVQAHIPPAPPRGRDWSTR